MAFTLHRSVERLDFALRISDRICSGATIRDESDAFGQMVHLYHLAPQAFTPS
jgi:hypothetical protein